MMVLKLPENNRSILAWNYNLIFLEGNRCKGDVALHELWDSTSDSNFSLEKREPQKKKPWKSKGWAKNYVDFIGVFLFHYIISNNNFFQSYTLFKVIYWNGTREVKDSELHSKSAFIFSYAGRDRIVFTVLKTHIYCLFPYFELEE